MSWRRRSLLAAIPLIIFIVSGCSSPEPPATATPTGQASVPVTASSPTPTAAGLVTNSTPVGVEFSNSTPVGVEFVCNYLDFHQPGVQTGWMLQVTYQVDVPDPSAAQAWRQAWTDAKATGQPVSGLGDDAFASGSKLSIKQGDVYLTFEGTDTHVDEKSQAGVQQLLAYEKQLAQAAVGRLK